MRAYLRSSENLHDFIVSVNFVLAAICRVVALAWRTTFDGTNIGAAGIEFCTQTTGCELYTAMMAILAVNFIVCCFRLLYMFSVFKSIGVLLVTFGDILKNDIRPWSKLTLNSLAGPSRLLLSFSIEFLVANLGAQWRYLSRRLCHLRLHPCSSRGRWSSTPGKTALAHGFISLAGWRMWGAR
jgi:hypothetical protein